MRRRALSLLVSLALTAVVMLVFSGSAFAQSQPNAIRGSNALNIPVAAGTNQPKVILGDAAAGDWGLTYAPFVADLDDWVAQNFGWRSSKPVTFVLFSNVDSETGAIQAARGTPFTTNEMNVVRSQGAYLMGTTAPYLDAPAGWVIFVNTDIFAARQRFDIIQGTYQDLDLSASRVRNNRLKLTGSSGAQRVGLIQYEMARSYAEAMVLETGGGRAPDWLEEGLADLLASRVMPGTLYDENRPMLISENMNNTGAVPTVTQLNADWPAWAGAGGLKFELSRGVAFLAVATIADRVGPGGVLNIIKRVGGGEDVNAVLMSAANLNVNQLNVLYQSKVPPGL